MPEKVMKCSIKKANGYKYFIDDSGDISRIKVAGGSPEKVMKCGIRKEKGYVYLIDNKGDISRANEKNVDKYPQFKREFQGIMFESRERIKNEERQRLQEQRLRYEVRKELLREEFKDLPQDNRATIPEEVRHEVWRRDVGKCTKCGSQENLEFDHIIPVSKGGANTARNIQLLCERCNREKSNNIA